MPFTQLVQRDAFDPVTIEIMSAAYDGACKALGLVDRSDPLTQLVAKKIIALATDGGRDPDRICAEVLKEFRPAG